MQVSFKFCPKCGKDLANNKEIKVRDETSGKKTLSFKEFKERKEKQRATFFRKKPGRGKRSGKQQEDLSDIVKINIGIMVPDSGQLRRVRGKSLTVNVPKNATASMLLEGGEAQSTLKRYHNIKPVSTKRRLQTADRVQNAD